jgi:hypothetical protein
MTQSVFSVNRFTFPYRDLKFPGQYTEEKILFITREGKNMLYVRYMIVILGTIVLLAISNAGRAFLTQILPEIVGLFALISLLSITGFTLIALLWVYLLWKKSLFIITTRRLTKFIHTTPWNRYQLSLGLDKIVDTGAYQKGFLQGLSGYGYFVARSAAGNIKNFKIINISFAEDLHNYINKLLFVFNEHQDKLDSFRPFVPHLKGDARKRYVRQITPEYYPE